MALLRSAVDDGTLVKLTFGKYRGGDASLRNLFVRTVTLRSGPHLTFTWRHATRDVTKNHSPAEAFTQLDSLLGKDFLDAHLFTANATAQLECQPDGTARLRIKATAARGAVPVPDRPPPTHDRTKVHVIPANAGWLNALGITNERGQPREGMADKFRQIQKFAELLSHLIPEAGLTPVSESVDPATSTTDSTSLAADSGNTLAAETGEVAARPAANQRVADRHGQPNTPLHIADMGCGKGYLTFAVATVMRDRANVVGVEARPELVELCNRVAREQHLANHLSFLAGTIATVELKALDILIALHACDTATDDALASGLSAGARLLVVSPCCQKELRSQLTAPTVLIDALRHGIFQERQAEFVTDALRAQLLEWAGYRTKVFEFISTEHTARNLMIAAIRSHAPGDPVRAARIREFAAFYGIRRQRLATHLGFDL